MTRSARPLAALVFALAISLGGGCADLGISRPANPSFAVRPARAAASLKEMAAAPRPLDRPLVILAGFADPGLGPWLLERRLRDVVRTRDGDRSRAVLVSYAFNTSFEGCRRRVVDAVERAFPSDDPKQTVEVDVIGISLGGVVARYAAVHHEPDDDHRNRAGKRLRVARLFTISSPHRGAVGADRIPALTKLHAELRTDSPFMRRLAASTASAGYAIYPYVRLGDKTVGVANAAPAGRPPYWVPNRPGEIAHGQAWTDPRILADIARRLRGEPPLATDPPAPLPKTARAAASGRRT